VNDELTVQQASAELGIKRGSVRKAFRTGRLEGRRIGDASQPRWSVLLLTRESVERYRRLHLGRPGKRPAEQPEATA